MRISKLQNVFNFVGAELHNSNWRYKLTLQSLYLSQKLTDIEMDYARLIDADDRSVLPLNSKIQKYLACDLSKALPNLSGLFDALDAIETQLMYVRLGCVYDFLEDFLVKKESDRSGLILYSKLSELELLEWMLIELWNRRKRKYMLLFLLGFSNLPPLNKYFS